MSDFQDGLLQIKKAYRTGRLTSGTRRQDERPTGGGKSCRPSLCARDRVLARREVSAPGNTLPRQPVQDRTRMLTARLSGGCGRIVDCPFIWLLQCSGVSRNSFIGNVTPTHYSRR